MKKVLLATFFITLIGVSTGKKHRECYHEKAKPMCDTNGVEYYNRCKFKQSLRKNRNLKQDYTNSCLNNNHNNEILKKNTIDGSASEQVRDTKESQLHSWNKFRQSKHKSNKINSENKIPKSKYISDLPKKNFENLDVIYYDFDDGGNEVQWEKNKNYKIIVPKERY